MKGAVGSGIDDDDFRSAERRYDTVSIVLVGKYVTLQDSYMSVVKSLEHASSFNGSTRPTSNPRPRRPTRSSTTTPGEPSVAPRGSSCPVDSATEGPRG